MQQHEDIRRMRRIEELIELNKKQSLLYGSPALTARRDAHRIDHKTEIGGTVCMDGRANIQQYTELPIGIFQTFDNVGGKFELGWPLFQDKINEWRAYATKMRRPCLMLTTYHFSRGDGHRGCAGFEYDTGSAVIASRKLRAEFMEDFGQSEWFYTIQCGLETDLEALVLHGNTGDPIDLSTLEEASSPDALFVMIRTLYPDMSESMARDLLPLVEGNIRHINDIRQQERKPVDIQHKEWIIAYGRGFEWISEINMALTVGPFDPNVQGPLITAGKVALDNLKSGRIPATGAGDIVFLTSVPYFEQTGSKPKNAARKARFFARQGYEILQSAPELKELLPRMERLTVTVDQNTRLMNVLERSV